MAVNYIRKIASSLWNYLREVSGENDYARYCARVKLRGGKPPSPRAFYVEQLERKNSRPTRCC
jgi:Selenoprotein, putative